GFKVQVRRAAAYGVEQHFVDEAHYRSVVSRLTLLSAFGIIADGFNVYTVQIDVAQILQPARTALIELVDGSTQLVVLHQNRLDGQPGAELNIGNRLVVGRIGNGDIKLGTTLDERQHPMLTRQFLANQLLG